MQEGGFSLRFWRCPDPPIIIVVFEGHTGLAPIRLP